MRLDILVSKKSLKKICIELKLFSIFVKQNKTTMDSIKDFEIEPDGLGWITAQWILSDEDDEGTSFRELTAKYDMVSVDGEIVFKWEDVDIYHHYPPHEKKSIWLWSMTKGMEKILLDDEAELMMEVLQNYMERNYDKYNTEIGGDEIADMYED